MKISETINISCCKTVYSYVRKDFEQNYKSAQSRIKPDLNTEKGLQKIIKALGFNRKLSF